MLDVEQCEINEQQDGIKTVIWLAEAKWITVLSSGAQIHQQNSNWTMKFTGPVVVRSSWSATYHATIGGQPIVLESGGSLDKEYNSLPTYNCPKK
jgi:hypothetical protein